MTLRISPDLELPLDAATETFAILGKRGSGKSNTAVVLFEEMHHAGIPCVAIDPKGDWYGIRSASDGKGPGLSVPVFGGRHGDIPLEPSAGAYLADLIVERSLTSVIDVSELSRADVIRFLTTFGQRLYRQATDQPMHLFLEECHEYLPQRVGPAEATLVNAWQRIVKQGRFKGIGCTLISQRSAAVNKDVLNQAEALFAMRVLAPHDRAAIKGWVEVHGQGDEILRSLHELADGEGWVWAPDLLGEPRRVKFRRRATFDSGATPKVGQTSRPPATLADVDVAAIKDAMAETIEKAKADDPAELRKRIAALERQLREIPTPEPVRIVEYREIVPGELVAVVDQARHALLESADRLTAASAELAEAEERAHSRNREATHDRQDVPRTGPAGDGPGPLAGQPLPAQRPDPPARREPRRAPVPGTAEGPKLGKRERLILGVLSQYPRGRSHRQLALLTGYSAKASTIGAGLSALRKLGYIEPSGDPVRATPEGLDAIAGQVEPLPTGRALLDYWMGQLGQREKLILAALVDASPSDLTHDQLAEITGYSPEASTIGAGLSKLRGLELVEGWALAPKFAEAIGV